LDNADLDFAIDLAQRAGDILLGIRERGLNPESIRAKLGHFDIVTEADVASERFILSELKSAYPSHGIISEETNQRFSDAEWVWIVDPLDGTTNYSHGLPIYAVNIALAHNGYPVLGVSHEPANNRTYWAVRGRGAWARSGAGNGETRLHVSDVNELKKAILATGFQYSRTDAGRVRHAEFAVLDNQTQSVRRLGSAAMTMVWVAAGNLEAYWESGLKAWDIAPGWVLIEEAGGHLIDYSGNPAQLTTTTLIMSNAQPVIDQAIMQTVADVAASLASGGAVAGLPWEQAAPPREPK
jgi:myo-inositol-1(or 4)-monophosphatase